MKRLALLTMLLLCGLLVCCVALAQMAGRTNSISPSPVRNDAAACALPCWHGIRPGETTLVRANQIMLSEGYTVQRTQENTALASYFPDGDSQCSVHLHHSGAVVDRIRLLDCPPLRLGDVMMALGTPVSLAPSGNYVTFAEGYVRVWLHGLACGETLTPFVGVDNISLSAQQYDDTVDVTWRGFMSPQRYAQNAPVLVLFLC